MPSKPISESKLAANRANARRSTGPRTAQGKSRSATNAITHGLLSRVLPEEPSSTTPSTLDSFTAQFAPASPLERSLVARLAALNSRLHRITEIEAGLFEQNLTRVLGVYPELAMGASRHLSAAYEWASKSINLLSFYEARLSRDFHRTLADLRQTQNLRRFEETTAESLKLELDKQSQIQAEVPYPEEFPHTKNAPQNAPQNSQKINQADPQKAKGPTSLFSRSGPCPMGTADENYCLAPSLAV